MNPLIYIETSIPSFYFETRQRVRLQARREWTREWWNIARWRDQLVSSAAVVLELKNAPEPKRGECLGLIEPLQLLQATPEIDRLVESYIENKVMPADADGDARHLAFATHWRCDALATWNCRHLANANKAGHVQQINRRLGYATPLLVTPLELLEVEP